MPSETLAQKTKTRKDFGCELKTYEIKAREIIKNQNSKSKLIGQIERAKIPKTKPQTAIRKIEDRIHLSYIREIKYL